MTTSISSHNLDGLIRLAGYERAKLQYMKLIVRCALESLSYAEAKMADQWGLFCTKDGALRKIPKSKKIAKSTKPALARPNENAVTYELAHHVDEFLKALPAGHEYREVNFRFERPKWSRKLAGSKQKRVDLQYEGRYPQGPEFVIEAKPLFSKSDIEKEYLGDSGLGRFLRDEEPFTDANLAALMGYVIQTEFADWADRLKVAIASDTRCEAAVAVSPVNWREDLWSTRHSRAARTQPIWMLHLLVTYPEATHPAVAKT